jgi:peptidyl-prolyl cis-trans isomerase SurA
VREGEVVDEIVAVVGDNAILLSDIEEQKLQMKAQGMYVGNTTRCILLEELLYQKLLLHQANLYSMQVSDTEVEAELERRMRYFINQVGSEEKLEEFFSKSIFEIKNDLRKSIRDQIRMQRMNAKITNKVDITPREVRRYYNELSEDSIELIPAQIEFYQIERHPDILPEEEKRIKAELEGYKKRVEGGYSFETLARLYSDDEETARRGGDLNFISRGDVVPEFARAAFNLKPGQVSPVIKTEYGFHIIYMEERMGELVRVRHILKKPKVYPSEIDKETALLDSVKHEILNDTLSFAQAVGLFSQDKNTRQNEGLAVNRMKGSPVFEYDELDAATYRAIKDLDEGETTDPFVSIDFKGDKVVRIIKIKKKTKAHKANLKEDYDHIKRMALEKKKQEYIKEWIRKKQAKTYIRIDEEYSECKFDNSGWKNTAPTIEQ